MIVDDGSSDQTWSKICEIINKYNHVSALRFARNFGKEIALCAGIDHIQAKRSSYGFRFTTSSPICEKHDYADESNKSKYCTRCKEKKR